MSGYPRDNPADTSAGGTRPIQQSNGLFITGQVPNDQALHTGGDIPLSAYSIGSHMFAGAIDNTDVFFKLVQDTVGGSKPATGRDKGVDD